MNPTLNPLKLKHDYPNSLHVPDLTCFCKPKVLSGVMHGSTTGHWGWELFDELVAVHA